LENITEYKHGREGRGVTAGGNLDGRYWKLLEWDHEPWTVDAPEGHSFRLE